MGCQPVAFVQYTFTHKQYTERHKTNNTQNNTKFENNTKILEYCGPCPDLASYTLAFAFQLRMFVPGNEVMLGNLVICTTYLKGGEVAVTVIIKF